MNLADRELSGSKEFRNAPRLRAVDACSSSFFSIFPLSGTLISKFAMIWSAIFRRSEERSGDNGLILHSVSNQCVKAMSWTDVRSLFKHFQE